MEKKKKMLMQVLSLQLGIKTGFLLCSPVLEGVTGLRQVGESREEMEAELEGSGLPVKLSFRERTDHKISLVHVNSREGKC